MTIKSLTPQKAELSNGNQTLVITLGHLYVWLLENKYLPTGCAEILSDLWNQSDILMIARRMQNEGYNNVNTLRYRFGKCNRNCFLVLC